MNSAQFDRIGQISRAIRFKKYLLSNDVSSRRIIIETCMKMLAQSPKVVAWFQNFQAINDLADDKERKEQIKVDAYWEEFILVHSADPQLSTLMALFMRTD